MFDGRGSGGGLDAVFGRAGSSPQPSLTRWGRGAGGGGNAGALSRGGGGPSSAWLPGRACRNPGEAITPVLGTGSGATCEPSFAFTRIVGSLRSSSSIPCRGEDCAGSGGGLVGELLRSGGGLVVEPARGVVIGGGFVVEPARGGSEPDVTDALGGRVPSGGGFVVEPARGVVIGGGFVVEPARVVIGGGFVVEPARGIVIGGGFVVEPARSGGAKPCDALVGLGAAANPAAVLVVDESGCACCALDALDRCAGSALDAVDRCAGSALDAVDRCAGSALDALDRCAGSALDALDRCAGSAPELVDGHAPDASPDADGAAGRTVVDVASPIGPL